MQIRTFVEIEIIVNVDYQPYEPSDTDEYGAPLTPPVQENVTIESIEPIDKSFEDSILEQIDRMDLMEIINENYPE